MDTFEGSSGFYGVTTCGMGGGMTDDGVTIHLSSIPGSVPDAFSSSLSLSSSVSPLFPIVSAAVSSEEGLETLTSRTDGVSQGSIVAFYSKSSSVVVEEAPS